MKLVKYLFVLISMLFCFGFLSSCTIEDDTRNEDDKQQEDQKDPENKDDEQKDPNEGSTGWLPWV